MCLVTALMLSSVFSNSFEEQRALTPFYSIAVEDIDLAKLNITVDEKLKYPKFKKESKNKFSVLLNKAHFDYYNKLPDLDKKVFIKIVSLELFREIRNKNYLSEQYTLLYKRDEAFNIETVAIVPMTYEKALPVITDYNSYNDWILKDINIRREGEKGQYFFEVNSLRYFKEKEQQFLELKVSMTKFSKGSFTINLLIHDSTKAKPVPSVSLAMNGPSDLTKDLGGTLSFIALPGLPYFVTYFTGRAEVGWIYYKLIPLNLIQSQFVERICTVLENIQYKAELVKQH